MSRWFRHYAGMMRDDKLVRVALRSKQPIERVLWVWGAILESAAEIDDNGRYDFDAGEAAYFLRADEDDILAVARELENAGRLDHGVVAKWSDRQFSSDRSAERQRRYRERQKDNRDGEQTVRSSDDNTRVTSPKRHCDAPDTETEADTEKEDTLPNVRVSKRARRADDFPMPEFADPEVWRDFLRNRKTKGLPNTQTAHGKMLADIDKLAARTGWPPGDILKACTAKGWGAIYETDEMKGNENGSQGRTYRSAAERPSGWLS